MLRVVAPALLAASLRRPARVAERRLEASRRAGELEADLRPEQAGAEARRRRDRARGRFLRRHGVSAHVAGVFERENVDGYESLLADDPLFQAMEDAVNQP